MARARAAQERRLAGWQEEHARRFRDWEARGRAFQAQRQWYGVALPTGIDRLDVAGGTLAGWSALTGHAGRPAAGRGRGGHRAGPVRGGGRAGPAGHGRPGRGRTRWSGCCPGTCPGWTSGPGWPARRWPTCWPWPPPAGDPAGPPDPVPDRAILERVARVLGAARSGSGPAASIGQMTAGLRVLAQIGDPRDDIAARADQRGASRGDRRAVRPGGQRPGHHRAGPRARSQAPDAGDAGVSAGHAAAEPPAGGGPGPGGGGGAHPGPRRVRHRRAHPAAPAASRAAPPGSTRCWSRGARSSAATCWTGCRTPARPAAPGWSWPTARSRPTSGTGWAGATPRSRSCGSATRTRRRPPASRSAPRTASWCPSSPTPWATRSATRPATPTRARWARRIPWPCPPRPASPAARAAGTARAGPAPGRSRRAPRPGTGKATGRRGSASRCRWTGRQQRQLRLGAADRPGRRGHRVSRPDQAAVAGVPRRAA